MGKKRTKRARSRPAGDVPFDHAFSATVMPRDCRPPQEAAMPITWSNSILPRRAPRWARLNAKCLNPFANCKNGCGRMPLSLWMLLAGRAASRVLGHFDRNLKAEILLMGAVERLPVTDPQRVKCWIRSKLRGRGLG